MLFLLSGSWNFWWVSEEVLIAVRPTQELIQTSRRQCCLLHFTVRTFLSQHPPPLSPRQAVYGPYNRDEPAPIHVFQELPADYTGRDTQTRGTGTCLATVCQCQHERLKFGFRSGWCGISALATMTRKGRRSPGSLLQLDVTRARTSLFSFNWTRGIYVPTKNTRSCCFVHPRPWLLWGRPDRSIHPLRSAAQPPAQG